MATLIPATGEWRDVRPANGVAFTLFELQTFVGGYIELLRAPDGRVAFCNEDGKRLALPPNRAASRLFAAVLRPDDWIVGDVIVCTPVEAGETDEPEE